MNKQPLLDSTYQALLQLAKATVPNPNGDRVVPSTHRVCWAYDKLVTLGWAEMIAFPVPGKTAFVDVERGYVLTERGREAWIEVYRLAENKGKP